MPHPDWTWEAMGVALAILFVFPSYVLWELYHHFKKGGDSGEEEKENHQEEEALDRRA